MTPLRDLQAHASAKLLAPFAATFAAFLVAQTGSFGGVQGGVAFSAIAIAMALLQGTAAARRAFPPAAMKALSALGLMALFAVSIASPAYVAAQVVAQIAVAAIVGGGVTTAYWAIAARAGGSR